METLIPKQTTIKANAISVGSSGEDRGLKDQTTIIIKRKRTKRPRPAIVTHSSTSYNAINSSPSSSSNFLATSTTTEDEDTANCLILLSKGHDIVSSIKNVTNDVTSFDPKFNSKKYVQTSTDNPGMYVYECKTCSRTFPSFQALGGHRASHNKPRNSELETKKPRYNPSSDEDETQPQAPQQLPSRKNNSSSSSSISIQLNYTNPLPKSTNKTFSKVHECSICGSEFNSGQALGGHMRRHRATPTTPDVTVVVSDTNTTLSLVPYNAVTPMVVDDQDNKKSRNDGLFFDLDLNLPAPSETVVAISDHDQLRGSLQPVAHLSATQTLVDCHY